MLCLARNNLQNLSFFLHINACWWFGHFLQEWRVPLWREGQEELVETQKWWWKWSEDGVLSPWVCGFATCVHALPLRWFGYRQARPRSFDTFWVHLAGACVEAVTGVAWLHGAVGLRRERKRSIEKKGTGELERNWKRERETMTRRRGQSSPKVELRGTKWSGEGEREGGREILSLLVAQSLSPFFFFQKINLPFCLSFIGENHLFAIFFFFLKKKKKTLDFTILLFKNFVFESHNKKSYIFLKERNIFFSIKDRNSKLDYLSI